MSLQFTMFDVSKAFESMLQQTFDVMLNATFNNVIKQHVRFNVHHNIDNHLNPFWTNLIIYKHAFSYWIDSFMVLILITIRNFGFCNCHLQLKFSYMRHMQLQFFVVA
jgi:hypothetical protein